MDAPASDFTPVAQAVLFPKQSTIELCPETSLTTISMKSVPFAATEVVKRGREYVKGIRAESQVLLLTETFGQSLLKNTMQWWINDALVLLYGDRDPDWETTKPTHTCRKWKNGSPLIWTKQ